MILTLTAAAFGMLALAAPHSGSTPMTVPQLQHMAPVLVVDRVEPCLKFWVDRFGFAVENQVPGPDGQLIFASAKKDGLEVMYQTRASVVAENPDAAKELDGHSVTLFITVNDMDAVEHAITGAPVVKPRHQTFYGSTEIYVREPGGNTVGFASFAK